jgi:hypothetical protein
LGGNVKLDRLFIASIFLLCASATVHADGIPPDGIVRVGHGTDPATPQPCGTSFNVPLNGHGGGIENCFNNSGQDWIGLDINAQIPVGDIVNCSSDIFASCTFTATLVGKSGKEKVDILLSGGDIPSSPFDTPSSEFFINLNDAGSSPSGSGGWFGADDGKLNGIVKVRALVSTPEPSVAILVLVGGLGVLCFWRRS